MAEHLKNPTLSGGRYLYSVYKGVPLPPGLRWGLGVIRSSLVFSLDYEQLDVERNCVLNLVAGEQSLNRVQGLYLQLFQFDVINYSVYFELIFMLLPIIG